MLAFSDTETEEKRGRKASLFSPIGGPHAGGLLRVTSKARPSVCKLCAGCRVLQVLQREIRSTRPIFKQIPLPAVPPPFPCLKQGICIKISQAQDIPRGQPPRREYWCLHWGSQVARLGPGALMSEQSSQHRSVLLLILCHAYLAQQILDLLFPFKTCPSCTKGWGKKVNPECPQSLQWLWTQGSSLC